MSRSSARRRNSATGRLRSMRRCCTTPTSSSAPARSHRRAHRKTGTAVGASPVDPVRGAEPRRARPRRERGHGVSGDQIIVTIPRAEGFVQVAALVLGGFASRLNITYESLDDLNTALETLVERAQRNGQVTVALRYDGNAVHAEVGPF